MKIGQTERARKTNNPKFRTSIPIAMEHETIQNLRFCIVDGNEDCSDDEAEAFTGEVFTNL